MPTTAAASLIRLFACTLLSCAAAALPASAAQPITPEAINAATLSDVPLDYAPSAQRIDPVTTGSTFTQTNDVQPDGFVTPETVGEVPSPTIARLQVLLDRAGASPGVIDGFDGENVRNAVAAFQAMHGLAVDGRGGRRCYRRARRA